ncbi:hypothetical protein Ddye_027876 [Dipteronia dyeriana]|uniref:Uncharacterized protein n=1 Tax=Dipteronia dyeriana TaxID=168575 RepID=A0AAD9WQX3_9ROSI|nr:hypothetical protein Ddye_027876 [Dipteronia dyeriana]
MSCLFLCPVVRTSLDPWLGTLKALEFDVFQKICFNDNFCFYLLYLQNKCIGVSSLVLPITMIPDMQSPRQQKTGLELKSGHGSSKDPTRIEHLSEASSILIEVENTIGMQ